MPWPAIDFAGPNPYFSRFRRPQAGVIWRASGTTAMKVRNSLKSAKNRERSCRIVRRRGRVFVINKRNKRFKARQG